MSEGQKFDRTCQICGILMHNVAANKKLCPMCLKKNQKIRDVQRKSLNRQNTDEKPSREPYNRRYCSQKKLTADSSIGAVCARAIAAGRTYGQQVEFERRQKELKDRGEINEK